MWTEGVELHRGLDVDELFCGQPIVLCKIEEDLRQGVLGLPGNDDVDVWLLERLLPHDRWMHAAPDHEFPVRSMPDPAEPTRSGCA